MKIVFLSQRFLLPMDTGGKIRTGKLLEQLAREHEITLISNIVPERDEPYLLDIAKLCHRFVPVVHREVPRHSLRFFVRLFLQMFSRYPVNVLNDYSRALKSALDKELANGTYDLAVCDFVQSALMFKHVHALPTLLFQHNVESMILARHVRQAHNPLAKLFWWLQWLKMSAFEKWISQAFTRVVAVSKVDLAEFRRLYDLRNVAAIPTGVDVEFFAPGNVEEIEDQLVFCGSMDWLPNEDAMFFFVNEILPLVQIRRPGVALTVVGRNPSPSFQKLVDLNPAVTLTGWVEDVRPYVARSSIYIVPIRIGGGTRIKIYEGMSMQKAVVSTGVGAEGLEVIDSEDIVLADAPGDFADALISLLENSELRRRLAANARQAVVEKFSWQKAARAFASICLQAVAAGDAPTSAASSATRNPLT